MKQKTYYQSNCALCAIALSPEMTEVIFFRKLPDDVILDGINERAGVFLTTQDLVRHRTYHIGYEEAETKKEKDEKINELEEIDNRIKAVRKKLKAMEAKNELFSHGYANLNKSLNDLIKMRNEIREGITVNLNEKISIREWIQKKSGGEEQK